MKTVFRIFKNIYSLFDPIHQFFDPDEEEDFDSNEKLVVFDGEEDPESEEGQGLPQKEFQRSIIMEWAGLFAKLGLLLGMLVSGSILGGIVFANLYIGPLEPSWASTLFFTFFLGLMMPRSLVLVYIGLFFSVAGLGCLIDVLEFFQDLQYLREPMHSKETIVIQTFLMASYFTFAYVINKKDDQISEEEEEELEHDWEDDWDDGSWSEWKTLWLKANNLDWVRIFCPELMPYIHKGVLATCMGLCGVFAFVGFGAYSIYHNTYQHLLEGLQRKPILYFLGTTVTGLTATGCGILIGIYVKQGAGLIWLKGVRVLIWFFLIAALGMFFMGYYETLKVFEL